MKYFSKEYRLVLVLSFLAVLLAGIKYFYKPVWPQQNKPNQITPISTPTPTPDLTVKNDIKRDYPLNGILPYVGKNFDIKQYEEPLTLLVKAKSKDKKAIEKEMLNLFEKEGIDINSHKFDWQN